MWKKEKKKKLLLARAGGHGLVVDGGWAGLDRAGQGSGISVIAYAPVCVHGAGWIGIPTGRGCMSCNTKGAEIKLCRPLGRMDGSVRIAFSSLTLVALTRELTLEGYCAHACARATLGLVATC